VIIWPNMAVNENPNLRNGSVFVAKLTTVGRRTGLPRTVELRLVYLGGKFYASSSKIESKHWCRNMIHNPAVEVRAGGSRYACRARQVTEENLRRQVLTLRDSPALLERVVFEMAPK
jgi:deazaflavin-dependent oxidoreductase (nitroreductase family)